MNKFKDFLKSFLVWFAVFYLILFGLEKIIGKKNAVNEPQQGVVQISPVKNKLYIGNLVGFSIENKFNKAVTFTSPCETPGSLKVLRIVNDQSFDISEPFFANCQNKSVRGFSLEPGNKTNFSLRDFNADLFSEEGKYQIEMIVSYNGDETSSVLSSLVDVRHPGILRQLFRAIVSKPLFNILVFLSTHLPGHSFGWAIVILTLLVRIALFAPNQKSMRSQRELQKLQPHIDEIKQRYGKNQQMIAMKTMELYKTHKINPMSSCLPILFQMPFLLGIYYIVRDGLSPHLHYLLYGFQKHVDLSVVDPNFFRLDLEINGPIYLALLVTIAQWGAIKLSFISAKKRSQKNGKDLAHKKEGMAGQMQQMNKIMLWVMPIMIGFFVTSFPAGVGIYWLTSTICGILQQKLVNWQLDKPQVRRKEESV